MQEIFNDYQKFTIKTAIYPGAGTGDPGEQLYLTLGLWGETMEWDEANDESEAGDVLYYLARLCEIYGLSLYDMVSTDHAYEQVNIAERLKKLLRDGKDVHQDVIQLMKNVIVVLKQHYSVMHLATFAKNNQEKLESRLERGVIQGEGSDR